MPGFKPTLVHNATGAAVEFRPVVVSVSLTPEQRMLIRNATGQNPEKLELSASDLKMVLLPIEAAQPVYIY